MGSRYAKAGTVCMRSRVGVMTRSARFDTNARAPSPNPIPTAAGTVIATRASEFIDSCQKPMTTM